MTWEKKYKKVYDKFNYTKPYIESESEIKECKKYGVIGGKDTTLSFGDWFLFEIIEIKYIDGENKSFLCYPKLAIFMGYLPCDQTLEVEYVEYKKTWEDRLCCSDNSPEENEFLFHSSPKTKSHIEWNDTMFVYGMWKSKPNWKELKESFVKTKWYHKDKNAVRQLRLNNLLST